MKTTIDLFGIGPVFPVEDIQASVNYYHNELGFDIDFVMGEPPTHGSVTRCKVGIQFTKVTEPYNGKEYPGWMYFFTSNIDYLYEEYINKNVNITRDLKNHNHGMREFEIEDCNGFKLRFGQYMK